MNKQNTTFSEKDIDLLPIINIQPSNYKIVTIDGSVFYAHNIKSEYRYDQRIKVITGIRFYFNSINEPTPIQDAYSTLLWYLFGEYINAFSFRYANYYDETKPKKRKKDLYVISNSQGFIKVRVSNNVKARIVDLKYEFGGEWEILKVYKNKSNKEKLVHSMLADYFFPIRHNHTGKYSTECFVDCEYVRSTCQNLSI